VSRGDLPGCSFRFACESDSWQKDSSGQLVRTLQKISVDELSVVSLPCYDATTVSTRSCPSELRSLLKGNKETDVDEELWKLRMQVEILKLK
jgi:phage head maturation protease